MQCKFFYVSHSQLMLDIPYTYVVTTLQVLLRYCCGAVLPIGWTLSAQIDDFLGFQCSCPFQSLGTCIYQSQIGTFAETEIVVCRLSFSDEENKLPFSVSVCSKQTKVAVFHWFCFPYMYRYKYIYILVYVDIHIHIVIYIFFS